MSIATASGSGTDDGVSVVLQGRITAYTAAPIWKSAIDTLTRSPNSPIIVDASRLEYVDDVGIASVRSHSARSFGGSESRNPEPLPTSPPGSRLRPGLAARPAPRPMGIPSRGRRLRGRSPTCRR